MAVARPQAPSGISAIHVWLIVFVALWLAATVLLVILYLAQEDKTKQIGQLQNENQRLISPDERKLPQFVAATASAGGPGRTVVGLLEEARAQCVELAGGEAGEDTAAVRQKLEAQMSSIRGEKLVDDPAVFDGVKSYHLALGTMFEEFRKSQSARRAAESGIKSQQAELEGLRAQQSRQKQEFDKQAEELKDRLATLTQERDTYARERDKQIDSFEEQIEKIRQQCSEDIQAQRTLSARLEEDKKELLARFNELKQKLGQAEVAPLPLTTARRGDGIVLTAKPGEDVVYVDLGRRDHVTLGLEFAIYDALEGVPEDGQAKARVEIVSINEDTSECRVVHTFGRDLIVAGDIVANPVYDRQRTLRFLVLGEFDLDGDTRTDADGPERISALIEKWGGQVEKQLSAMVDFVIVGGSPPRPPRPADSSRAEDPLYRAAVQAVTTYESDVDKIRALGIPTLTQSVFLNFLGYTGRSGSSALSSGGP